MMSRRAVWVFLLLLCGCGYARFKGAIPIVRDATSLRVVGAFSPDGSQFAAGVDGRIHVWDVKTGKLRARIEEDPRLLRQTRFPLAVARDGDWIAYGRTDGQVGFADPSTGMRLGTRPSGGREIYDLAPSPD